MNYSIKIQKFIWSQPILYYHTSFFSNPRLNGNQTSTAALNQWRHEKPESPKINAPTPRNPLSNPSANRHSSRTITPRSSQTHSANQLITSHHPKINTPESPAHRPTGIKEPVRSAGRRASFDGQHTQTEDTNAHIDLPPNPLCTSHKRDIRVAQPLLPRETGPRGRGGGR